MSASAFVVVVLSWECQRSEVAVKLDFVSSVQRGGGEDGDGDEDGGRKLLKSILNCTYTRFTLTSPPKFYRDL